jgi:GNAT superfamily N-acetyltransferase
MHGSGSGSATSTSTRSARRRPRASSRRPCPGSRSAARGGATSTRSRVSISCCPSNRTRSPVFSPLSPLSLEEARRVWEESFDDERLVTFVAERNRRILGCSIACPVEVSFLHAGLTKVPGAGLLGYAAVFPDARGLGAGRAPCCAVLEWSRLDGREWCVTDWRMTNLLASRARPRLGFHPTFYRLHRRI